MIKEDSLFNAMIDALSTHVGTVNNINWNNGITVKCFLFDGMWFPLRATVNHARWLQGLTHNAITTECERNLNKVFSPLKPFVKDMQIQANQLPIATFSDEIEGRKRKWEAINALNAREQLIQGYS